MPSSVGRYRIDRVLGSGAFATVLLGHDDQLQAPVAIKVLAGSLLDDLDVRNRFLEEARILRRADSERLVRVHDIGELPDGRPYFVMSYADRGTLADRMRERPLSVSEAIAIAEDIAYGVEVINRLGIIHRDLKPSNILFQTGPDGRERLLIADLGLAKALAHASGAFTLPVGTPGYMSPEQAKFGGGLDVRSDVYGLGALTYHLLTGRPPGPAPVQQLPSQLRPEIGPEFDEVILRALEADRERRFPTAETFARALSSLRPTEAPHPAGGDMATILDAPPAPHGKPPKTAQDLPGVGYGAQQGPPPPLPGVQGPVPGAQQGPPPPLAGAQQVPPPPVPGGPQGSPDDIGTTEVRVPPAFRDQRRPGGPDASADRTALFPVVPGGPAAPGAGAGAGPGAGQGPGGPGQVRGVPLQPYQGGAPITVPQGGGPGPYRGQQGSPPPAPGGSGGDKGPRKLAVPIAIAGGVLAVAVVGGLFAGTIFNGGGGGKPKTSPKPTVPSNFATVTNATGNITASVPKDWKAGTESTWAPSTVGLTGTGTEPVLRAAPDITLFRSTAAKTPGVFIGETTDLTAGAVPPASVSQHAHCTAGKPVPKTVGSFTGTVTTYTACTIGVPTISEIGLVDQTHKIALWIRIKQIDPAHDLTDQILNTIVIK
ncbi:MAG TPA: protein kinase [Streptosporangiaceae bacterium]|nr:protein kinase [Streptosporangiaceae bacterium]